MINALPLVLALTLGLAQGPAPDFEKILVLREVRTAGFAKGQIVVLLEAAAAVDLADAEYDAAVEAARRAEDALAGVLAALAAGQSLTAAQEAEVDAASASRAEAEKRWNQRVEGAVTRVMGTLTEEQRYRLGVPENVRKTVEDTWNQIRQADNATWDRLARSLTWRIVRNEMNALRSANAGGSDRSQRQDRSSRSRESRAMSEELQRQGRAYLDRVRSGNPVAVRGFRQQLASSYLSAGEVERRLRELVRKIITADAAAEALSLAKGG